MTVTPEHEAVFIPSERQNDLALVVFLAVAVYRTPALIGICCEKMHLKRLIRGSGEVGPSRFCDQRATLIQFN